MKPAPHDSRTFRRLAAALGLLVTLAVPTVEAHEFWLTPNASAPQTGEPIAFRLSLGDGFAQAEPFPRDPSHLKRFWVRVAGAEFDVPGVAGASWIGAVRPTVAGPVTVGYVSHSRRVELDGTAFDRYLVEEGLVAAQRLRLERREMGQPATESFRRCAKSVVQVSGAGTSAVAQSKSTEASPQPREFDASLGLELEITPVTSPLGYRPGTPFTVRVEQRGQPAPAGMKVRAQCAEHPRLRVSGRTDAAGRVNLTLPESGFWLLSTVAMERTAPGADTDWESVWSSLTFTVATATNDKSARPKSTPRRGSRTTTSTSKQTSAATPPAERRTEASSEG